MKKPGPPHIEKFPVAKQRRIDQLLEKNSEGTITLREKAKLEQLVTEAEQLMVGNARRLVEFARREGSGVRAHAVPVTVWVQSGHVEP
jgi:hypothetical protein